MDAPIISIYDMLLKRHRQQKKVESGPQKELTSGPTGRQNNNATRTGHERSTTDGKKLKVKTSRTKINVEAKEKQTPKIATNVITATHLTKKHTGILMPPLTKKEVLNQLIERMTNSSKKQQEKQLSNESSGQGTSPGDEDSDRPIISIKKMKPKTKNLKPIPLSASSQSRRRLALSPRNTNSIVSPKQKREKAIKNKVVSTPKAPKPEPNKRHPQSGKSKISIVSKKEDRKMPQDEHVIRYRL